MPVGLNQGAWQQGTGYTALNQGAWQGYPDVPVPPIPPTPPEPEVTTRRVVQGHVGIQDRKSVV